MIYSNSFCSSEDVLYFYRNVLDVIIRESACHDKMYEKLELHFVIRDYFIVLCQYLWSCMVRVTLVYFVLLDFASHANIKSFKY